MKMLMMITLLMLSTSAFVIAEPGEKQPRNQQNNRLPKSINQLQQVLEKAKHHKADTNSRLRLDRANFYYKTAIEYFQSGWQAKAQDFAQRGMLLVELHNRSKGQPNFYIFNKTSKPQTSLATETATRESSTRNGSTRNNSFVDTSSSQSAL